MSAFGRAPGNAFGTFAPAPTRTPNSVSAPSPPCQLPPNFNEHALESITIYKVNQTCSNRDGSLWGLKTSSTVAIYDVGHRSIIAWVRGEAFRNHLQFDDTAQHSLQYCVTVEGYAKNLALTVNPRACVDESIPLKRSNAKAPMSVWELQHKTSQLRKFLAENRQNPERVVFSMCKELRIALNDHKQSIQVEEELDAFNRHLVASGVKQSVVPFVEELPTPNEACRAALMDDTAIDHAKDLQTVLRNMTKRLMIVDRDDNFTTCMENVYRNFERFAPTYLVGPIRICVDRVKEVMQEATASIEKLDDPETHCSPESTKAALDAVLSFVDMLIDDNFAPAAATHDERPIKWAWRCEICNKPKDLYGTHLKEKTTVRSECRPCAIKRTFNRVLPTGTENEEVKQEGASSKAPNGACRPNTLRVELVQISPHAEIAKYNVVLAKNMQRIASTVGTLLSQLHRFLQAAEAFKVTRHTFAGSMDEAKAKIAELKEMEDEIHDKQIDSDEFILKLKRRRLKNEAEKEKLSQELVSLKDEIRSLRVKFQRCHRIAIKSITSFFPELRRELVDANDFVAFIPQFDATMTRDCFENIARSISDGSSSSSGIEHGELNERPVVLKNFTHEQKESFKRECKVYNTVQNPFVGELFAAFSDDEGLVTVMPRYEGGTANTWADDAYLTIRVLRQVADGLRSLHRAEVTHCDFKPQNVVMTAPGHHGVPKLIDFGCADVQESSTLLVHRIQTQTLHTLTGYTPQYVAPEISRKLTLETEKGSGCAAEALADLVRPALDVYAFGRWMSEVLQCPASHQKKFCLPESEDGAITAPMLIALLPHQEPLQSLINRCLNTNASNRPHISEVAETLCFIEFLLQNGDSDKQHVEVNEVLECSICGGSVKKKDSVACRVAVGSTTTQESHLYCRECLKVMIQDWRSKPVAKHADRYGKVTCSFGCSCEGVLNEHDIIALLPEAMEDIAYIREKIAEFKAIEDVKRRYENESLEQRVVRHVEENIMALRCPKCQTHCIIGDFVTECLAMTCPRCDAHFCGYCEENCGADAHSHVTSTHRGANDPGLFTTKEKWSRFRYNLKKKELEEYISTLPNEIATKVKKLFVPV